MKKRILMLVSIILSVAFLLSGCGAEEQKTTKKKKEKLTIEQRDKDMVFSIAVIPDTQSEQNFKNRSEWLVANEEKLDLRAVLHTGDVVNWGDADESQLVAASDAMSPFDKTNIKVGIALGNHDTAAVGVGGSAAVPSDTGVRVRDTSAFQKYFPSSRYPDIVPMEEGYIENSYSIFSAGGAKWMILCLELWPRVNVVDWANEVVLENKDCNVFIVTHSYLNSGGDIVADNGGYGANSPQYLFDNLISRHENIKFVFSGHEGESAVREDYGENGNKIISVLGCYHKTRENPVRLLEIDVLNGTIESEVYCPVDEKEWLPFGFSMDGMEFIKSE